MGLLPYGRKEKDEKEQRVQRMQRTPHDAEFDPESLSDPPDLRWLTHWLVGLAGEYIEGRGGCSACRRNRNCPPVSLSPARRFPELRSQAEERAVQALVFGSPVCPEGDLGGLEGLVT